MIRPKYMVAVDFSPQSQTLVDHACGLARNAQAELHLVHVGRRYPTPSENLESSRINRERLCTLVRPADELEVSTEKVVVDGIPHRALVEYASANAIDLIVMATHGRKGLSHLALGSVAERVLRNAPCPVQVVKSFAGVSDLIDRAAEALKDKFGEQLDGSCEETKREIRTALTEDLDVSDAVATNILDELQQRQWAVWQRRGETEGTWSFVQEIEFVELGVGPRALGHRSSATELIARARQLRATDVHIDPVDLSESCVRLRIDGQLSEYCRLDREICDHLVNQLKTMAGLGTADPFKPKEGRITFPAVEAEFRDLEARLTTVPVASGDAVAIRLFSRDKLFIPLDELGLGPASQAATESMLQHSEGLILVTGPTGSGKTTTVYSMLETIGSSGLNIVSIEDPVEYFVPFVRQMEVKERYGLTMVEGLKTMLRMDPDVVFLGEIRDAGAAEIAMRAASSGRYVFSTLHTRDVASVVTALRGLGLTNQNVAANVSGIINQRLMRRLCKNCRQVSELTSEAQAIFEKYSIDIPSQLYRPRGCSLCRESGYYGRIGAFEAFAFGTETRSAIASGLNEAELREVFAERGMVSLHADALGKVADGITDLDEAMRIRWLM